MNTIQLQRMSKDKGFIAALDQSGGSTPKALALYGISESAYHGEEEMYTAVHAMRTRVMTSPVFTSDRILGVILFENTMDREVDGAPTAQYLWTRKNIVPFLKIDKGLAERKNGVSLMKPMPDLDALLEKAVRHGIFGTKMRSVVYEADGGGIASLAAQQFAIARQVAAAGLVPIIEPEIDIRGKDKRQSETLLKRELRRHLDSFDAETKVMFKLSIPDEDDFYADLMPDPRVVRVVALSGGYSRAEADERLKRNKGLIASFSRALLEGLRADQSDEEFNRVLGTSIREIYEASAT